MHPLRWAPAVLWAFSKCKLIILPYGFEENVYRCPLCWGFMAVLLCSMTFLVCFVLFVFSQSSFSFTAKLRGRYRDLPHTPCLPQAQPPPWSSTPTRLVDYYDWRTRTHTPSSPKVHIYLQVLLSWCSSFCGFKRWCPVSIIMISCRIFSCPQSPLCSDCSFLSPPSQPPATLVFLSVSTVFWHCFPKCHMVGTIIVCSLFPSTSSTQWYAFKYPPCLFLALYFFLLGAES